MQLQADTSGRRVERRARARPVGARRGAPRRRGRRRLEPTTELEALERDRERLRARGGRRVAARQAGGWQRVAVARARLDSASGTQLALDAVAFSHE